MNLRSFKLNYLTDYSSVKLPDKYSELIKLILSPKQSLRCFTRRKKRFFLSYRVKKGSKKGQTEVKKRSNACTAGYVNAKSNSGVVLERESCVKTAVNRLLRRFQFILIILELFWNFFAHWTDLG